MGKKFDAGVELSEIGLHSQCLSVFPTIKLLDPLIYSAISSTGPPGNRASQLHLNNKDRMT